MVWCLALAMLFAVGLSVQAEQVTLEAWIITGAAEVQARLDEFHAQHPDIRVNISTPTWNALGERVPIAFATNTAPDLIQGGGTNMPQFIKAGWVMPLNDLMDKWGQTVDFAPAALRSFEYNGVLGGLPLIAPTRSLWYRKDIFREHGLDAEDPPETWEEIRDAARKIVRFNGDTVTRIGFQTPGEMLEHAFLTNEVDWFNEDATRPAFNTPKGLEATAFWSELGWEMTYPGQGVDIPARSIQSGHVGMTYGYVNPAVIRQFDPRLLSEIGGPVTIERSVKGGFVYPDGIWISSQTKHPEEAWTFLKWVTDPDLLAGLTTHPSPRRSSYENPYYESVEGDFVRRTFMESTLIYGHRRPFWPDYLNMRHVHLNMFQRLIGQELSPAAALEQMETELNAWLTDLNANSQ